MRRHVEHAAALDPVAVPHRALRKHVVHRIPVVRGIRVDQAADGAVLRRDLRLDAAPRGAVPRDDDGALDRDAAAFQLFVVRRPAVVDVDERAGDVAVDGVRVVAGQLLRRLTRGGIDGERRLTERRLEGGRRDHLDEAFFRRREEDLVGLDARVPSPFLEARGHPFGVVLAVGRSDVMRARAQPAHVLADVRGARQRAERGVPCRSRVLRGDRYRPNGGRENQHRERASHRSSRVRQFSSCSASVSPIGNGPKWLSNRCVNSSQV